MNITEIIKGASYSWNENPCNYLPSDGWTMKAYFRGAGTGVNLDAEVDGDTFVFSLTTTQTAGFAAGAYAWQQFAEKDDEKVFISEGNVTVRQGFAEVDEETVVDNRSQVKITLDAIDAVLANKATADQYEYSIGNRHLKRYMMSELLELRKTYQKLYNQELQAEAAKVGKRKLFTPFYGRFKRPR